MFNWPNEIQFVQIYWKISVDLERTWKKISLDVEIGLNNRPLTYVGNIQLNVLTPNSLIAGRDVKTINSKRWSTTMQRERVENMKTWIPSSTSRKTKSQPQRQNKKSKNWWYRNDQMWVKEQRSLQGWYGFPNVCWERLSCESSSNASWDKLSGSPDSTIVPFRISFSVPVRKVKEQEKINLNAGAKES